MQLRVVLLAALVGLCAASAGHGVQHLTTATYVEQTGDGKVWFIKFYAPWCGHCKRLAPTWDQLADSFKGSEQVAVASVDCTEQQELCTQAGIRGYPTLKAFHGGQEIDVYRGSRELEALKTYITDKAKTQLDLTTA